MCVWFKKATASKILQEVGVKAGGQRDGESRAEILGVNPAPAEPGFAPRSPSSPRYLNTSASVPLASLLSGWLCSPPGGVVPGPGQLAGIGVPWASGQGLAGSSRMGPTG